MLDIRLVFVFVPILEEDLGLYVNINKPKKY